jgi:hypothetical protein
MVFFVDDKIYFLENQIGNTGIKYILENVEQNVTLKRLFLTSMFI